MITEQQYVILSLELNMFFGRIMKEHSLFLEAGFTPANPDFSNVADQYKQQFEAILHNAVVLGNGIISPIVASSGEIVTDYTLGSEQKTQYFTGIAINQEITKLEEVLYGAVNPLITPALIQQVSQLNALVKPMLEGLIDFKTGILNEVLSCRMFTANYPLLIDHILREAKMYYSHLVALENRQNPEETLKETELFWDQIMMEHALFMKSTAISKKRVQRGSMNAKYAVLFYLCWRIMCCVNQTIISDCFDNCLNALLKKVLLYRSKIKEFICGHSCIFVA